MSFECGYAIAKTTKGQVIPLLPEVLCRANLELPTLLLRPQ